MGKAYGFSRTRKGRIELRVDEVERILLISLAQQMIAFVEPDPADPEADPLATLVGIDAEAEVPDDPALARLFPDAFIDDDESAADFRRFTERGLRETKAGHARVALADLEGGAVAIDEEHVAAWLGFLNDTRLALGSRLDISEDSHEEMAALPEEDPRLAMFHVYDWLTFLQDSLVQHLLA